MFSKGPENFQRLDEFPSFISCIKCFGRPIIPPLLTQSRRHELEQLRVTAINKETEMLRKKELLKQQQDILVNSRTPKDDYRSDFQSSMQENCALWYPSSKDSQEGISVAISKFPTSGIYSSVHTGAIVCSNVIEDSHTYAARIRDSLYGSETSVTDCIECAHNNMNVECSLCQAEYNQSFHNRSFTSEVSSEVPCRTFSLLQQNVSAVDSELNSVVDDAECESLPTVICNQKYIPPDTDSESNATCMSQSTDLEKYMEFPCEFSSPDNSALVWDSKSNSQQYTLSRSDDASSETIVNTENELTPCASIMAEFTDNIEDELSNADETPGISYTKDMTGGTLKRAHSVDSYMKILQTCARSMNVKKSQSAPFNTNQQSDSGVDDTKVPISSKTSLLIKEDSKESEESKDIPEKDTSVQEYKDEILTSDQKTDELKVDDASMFKKRHVRQNSYTLDRPSSALILAHADCTCNFDANCISPHSSALTDDNEVISNFPFIKEKVEIDNPLSHHQAKELPILSSDNLHERVISNEEDKTAVIVDVFSVVSEGSCEKSTSGNDKVFDSLTEPETTSANESKEEENLIKMFTENLNLSYDAKHTDYVNHIYQELRETHEMCVKKLVEEQNRQWLKLHKQFKDEEKLLIEKLKQTLISSTGSLPKNEEKSQIKMNVNKKIANEKSSSQTEVLCVSNSSISSLDQMSSSDNSSMQNPMLIVPSGNSQLLCSPSKTSILPQNIRASISPSREHKPPINGPSIPVENIKAKQSIKDSDASISCNFKSNANCAYSVSEPVPSINGFPFVTSTLPLHSSNLPGSQNAIAVPIQEKCDKMPTCFCDNSIHECKCCLSFNGYCDYDVNASHPEYLSHSKGQNSVLNSKDSVSDNDFLYSQNSSSSSGVQSKNLNPDVFINCHSFNKSRKMISSNSSDAVCSVQNVKSASFDNAELSSYIYNKGKRTTFSQSMQEELVPVNNIVSLCANNLKNGTLALQDRTLSSRMIDSVLLKKFEKLPAFVRGYLTRRLFKTERVQSLIKTLQDTALLIGKLSEDLPTKGDPVSQKDVDFHRQLIVQLMTTFHNVYDIFCTISIKEKMNIIAESRNFRFRQKNAEQTPESNVSVTANAPVPVPSKKHKLSSATLKVLQRKSRSAFDSRTYPVADFKNARSRSVIDMRTYTIDDLPNFKGRTQSSMSSKGLSGSPSSIYKNSVGITLKRKTISAKSSGSRRCLHHKWVP